jgi:aryl-alcohol dehydrogenase-like predicted oxidoreductase
MVLRPLGSTGIQVSPLGLGTVKFGRNQQVKYPTGFALPSDKEIVDLLALSRELGINHLDTAPAYGTSQERLGKLLTQRQDWVIVSKVGESFIDGQSSFDFRYQATTDTVHNTLKTLGTDYLDCVLIHSDGDDMAIFEQGGAVEALSKLKEQGLIRSHGMSSKTVDGGLRVVEAMDVVMATSNLGYNDELPVLQRAAELNKGVFIKKGLMSGHIQGRQGVLQAMRHVFSQPGVSSMIVGTINPDHLRSNVDMANQVVG